MAKRKMLHPYWRPNYRIASTLPDIKIIRTGFLINGIAIIAAVAMVYMVLQKEYRAYALTAIVSDLKNRADIAEPSNKKSLALNERFLTAGKYVQELDRYYRTPFEIDSLLVSLSNSVPQGLIFNSMTLQEVAMPVDKKKSVIGFRINVSGSVNELIDLNKFKGELMEADFLNPEGYSVQIDETVQAPDPDTRVFPFQFRIEVKPAQAKGGQ